MENAKHTPGPWELSDVTKKGKRWISALGWGKFASIFVVCGGGSSAEGEANARLIAAAPELLAALNRIAEGAFWLSFEPQEIEAHVRGIARAAIAKAMGEA